MNLEVYFHNFNQLTKLIKFLLENQLTNFIQLEDKVLVDLNEDQVQLIFKFLKKHNVCWKLTKK